MATTSYNVYQQITSVRLATTANLLGSYFNGQLNNGVGATLTAASVGALVVDGINANVGDRILLKNQTNTNENGIYQVNATGGPISLWQIERSADFQSIEQLKIGQYFSVGAGNTLAGVMFVLVEPLPNQIGTGNGTFNFVNVSDGAGGGPFLTVSGNLSDVANTTTAFENIGLGRPGILLLTDADFAGAGGTYVLTNPPPTIISMSATSPGRVLQLPPQNEATSIESSQQIELLTGGSQSIGINNGAGTLIFLVDGDSAWRAVPNDRSTIAGAWQFLGEVQTINGSHTGNVVLESSSTTIYISNSGNDVTGDGSVLFPYQTLSAALAAITPSSSSPYRIVMNGTFGENNLSLKPWCAIDGNNSSNLTVSGSVTLDASWTDGGELNINNFFNVSWPASVTLDFSVVTSGLALFNFSNCFESGSTTLNIIGHPTSGALILLQNLINFSGMWVYNITNCYGSISGGDTGNIIINHTSESTGGNFSLINLTTLGNVSVTDNTTSGLTLFHEQCKVIGTTTYTENGAGTFTCSVKGMQYIGGAPTIDNGLGGGSINFVADILNALPTFVNGATYTPTSIGNSINANFIPSNYSPSDISVTGHLIGIDNALGGGGGDTDLQGAYNNGSDAEVILSANRPVSFVNPVFTSGSNSVVTPGTGTESTANYANYGWTFTPTDDITVISLQYNDDLFVGTGTREAGIFLRNTQELLGSDFISKTDPLDVTNTYRTKVLEAPITLTGGIEYVFVIVIPPTEIHHPNDDAVPDIEITITEARTSIGSHDPQPLQFPTFNIVVNNRVYAGSFQFNLGVAQEEFTINDTLSGGSELASVISTTRGTSLEPLMTTVQKNAISSPVEGIRVYDTNIHSPFFYNGSDWIKLATNLSTRIVYLNSYVGNDTIADENGGSIGCPFLTYAAAVSHINGLSPTNTNRFTILATGIFNEDLPLIPHIDIIGNGSVCTFNGSSLYSDAAYNNISGTASTLCKNINSIMSSIQFIEIDNSNFPDVTITFDNVNFNLTSGQITFFNDRDNPNIKLNLFNVTSNQQFDLSDCQTTIINGINLNVFLFPSNLSTSQNTFIQNVGGLIVEMENVSSGNNFCTTTGCSTGAFAIDDAKSFWTPDITSYIDPVLTGGATVFNTEILTSAGGINCATYSPVNFTPVAGSTYYAASLLGYLRGIDVSLLKAYGEMYVISNTRSTTFASAAYTKIEAGNPLNPTPDFSGYASTITSHFTFSNGRLTYTGTPTLDLLVNCSMTLVLSTGVAILFQVVLGKNGSAISKSQNAIILTTIVGGNPQPITTQATVTMSTNDYIEVFASNVSNTGDKFVAQFINLSIK